MENNETESSNINIKWLESIYIKLMQLEECLALSRDGFSSMPELLQTATISLPEIQCRNFSLITTIFSSLLNNVQPVISQKYYEETRRFLDLIRRGIDYKSELYFDFVRNDRAKQGQRSYRVPNEAFYKTIDLLEIKRAELVVELKEILYLVEKQQDRKPLSQ